MGLSRQSEIDAEIGTVLLRFQATPRHTMSQKPQAAYWQDFKLYPLIQQVKGEKA